MKYTDSHEWISIEDEVASIGITRYAKEELGEIVYVELPALHTVVQAGDEVAVLESTKAAADVYSPISGTIVAVNDNLKNSPHLLNEDPERLGWLFKIQIHHPEELDILLEREEYLNLISK